LQPKTKILHLVTTVEQGRGLGGAEKLILFLCDALNKDKYEFVIAYHVPDLENPSARTEAEKLFKQLGVKVCLFKTRNKFDVFAVFGLLRIIRREKPDIVHSHQPRLDFLGSIAAFFAGVPFVVTRHLSIYRSPIKSTAKFFYQFFDRVVTAAFFRKIIAVSKEVADDLIGVEKVSREKVKVVHNGINVKAFADSNQSQCGIREEFKLGEGPLAGVVARINKQKSLDLFLEAAAEVKKSLPEARYLIVGDGPLADEIKQLSRKLNLEKEVVFAGYREDIPRIISGLDVVVLSSLSEGLPVVILEAMALSKPVVSFKVGGVPEIIENEKNGILVPVSDTHALAEAIIRIFKNPQLAAAMGSFGRKTVEQNFSLKAMLDGYLGVYEKIIGANEKK